MTETEIEEMILASSGDTPNAIGFLNGRLVHLDENGVRPITLKESAEAFAEIHTDGSWTGRPASSDVGALVKWMEMIANVL